MHVRRNPLNTFWVELLESTFCLIKPLRCHGHHPLADIFGVMASREKGTDELVMGASAKDSLKGMTRFGAKEGTIVWPSWQAELRRKVVFEMGAVGMKIIEGELSSKDIKVQMKAEEIGDLLKSLLTRGRAGVKYDEDWTGGCQTDEEEEGEASNVFLNQVMTTVGVLNVQQAIENIKKSYFLSIEEYGLVQDSKISTKHTKK